MIEAQFLKSTCLFTRLPGLSCHTAPSRCHAGSSLGHRTLQSQRGQSWSAAVEAQLPTRTDPQPPRQGRLLTTGPPGSPQPLISGVVSFFFFWLCWAFTAIHGFSPVGLNGSCSALAELGLSGRRLLLWSAGPRAPPA